jgi:transposase InsO family protein
MLRRKVFHDPPTLRNQVWQTDFSEFETSGGGIWRTCAVIDDATKYCLAITVTPTARGADALAGLRLAVTEAEQVFDLDDLHADRGLLKYEHLFRGVITDGDALDMEVHRFRIIYNTIRPHQALGDRTPSEAYTGCDKQKPLDKRQKWALRSSAVQRSLPFARAASSVAASMSVKVPVSILSINGPANRPSGPPLGT